MDINFEKDHLKELYENGKSRNKKYRFQPNVVKKYIKTIDKLRAAQNTEELYPIKSLNYKQLEGTKKGIASVRVDEKYRIEFRTIVKNNNLTDVTICSIIELSNHYM